MNLRLTKKHILVFLFCFSFLRIPIMAFDMIMILKKFLSHSPWTEVIVIALLMSIIASILSIIFICHDYIVGKKQAEYFKNVFKQPGSGICTWSPRSIFYQDLAQKVLMDTKHNPHD